MRHSFDPSVLEQASKLFLLPFFGAAVDFVLVGDDAAEQGHDFVVRFQFEHAVEHLPHLDQDLVGQGDRLLQLGRRGGRVLDAAPPPILAARPVAAYAALQFDAAAGQFVPAGGFSDRDYRCDYWSVGRPGRRTPRRRRRFRRPIGPHFAASRPRAAAAAIACVGPRPRTCRRSLQRRPSCLALASAAGGLGRFRVCVVQFHAAQQIARVGELFVDRFESLPQRKLAAFEQGEQIRRQSPHRA